MANTEFDFSKEGSDHTQATVAQNLLKSTWGSGAVPERTAASGNTDYLPALTISDGPSQSNSAKAAGSNAAPLENARPNDTNGYGGPDYGVSPGIPSQTSESQFPAPRAPELGLSGFDQKAPDTSTNPLGQLGYGLKGLVGADPTLQDQLTKKELSDLTPQQLQEYNKENAEMRSRETLMYAGPMKPLDTPMHDLVNSRVEQDERQIANKVQSNMSPSHLKELQAEWNKYTAPHPVNPAGGPAGYPIPAPGPEIQAYYQQVEAETERYLNQN